MQRILEILQPLVVKNWKAWAGFIVTAIVAYLAQHGIDPNMTIGEAVEALVYGPLGWLVVWISPRNK